MPEETDLVLDLNEYDGKEVVDYYFADHEKRIIVFMDEFSSDYLPHWCEIKGVSSGTHLRMSSLPSQYIKKHMFLISLIRGIQDTHWKYNTGN